MRQLLSFAMLCMAATATVAQHHHNSWFKLAATYTVHARYKVEVDVHHRRQNGFDNHNQLDHALLYAARLSLHYSPRPSLTLSLSPLAHFSNYRVIQAKVDENAPPQSETRLAAAVSVQSKLRNKWALVNRTMAEYRMFQGRLPNSIRLRHRLGLRWEPVPKMTIGLHNELLANLPDAHARTFFDHNRLGAQVWYKLGKHLQLELGYIYINRRQRNTDVFWEEDNWLLGLVMGW